MVHVTFGAAAIARRYASMVTVMPVRQSVYGSSLSGRVIEPRVSLAAVRKAATKHSCLLRNCWYNACPRR